MKCKTICSNLRLILGTIIGIFLGTRGKQGNAGRKTMEKSEFYFSKNCQKFSMHMENF